MPISTYDELKTAVTTTWQGGRTDQVGQAADWIYLAEDWLNTELPLRAMWVDVPLTGTIGSNLLPLPVDYVEPGALFITTYNTQEEIAWVAKGTGAASTIQSPSTKAMIGETSIELQHPCDVAHTFLFHYRKRFRLSDAEPTNYLLTKYPRMYLAASLVEAYASNIDSEGLQLWGARRGLARDEIARIEARGLAVAPLQTDLPMRGGFNIYSGE